MLGSLFNPRREQLCAGSLCRGRKTRRQWSWVEKGARRSPSAAPITLESSKQSGNTAKAVDLFNGTVQRAIYAAIKSVTDQNSKDIYIYWGLHFTSLSAGHSAEQSRQEVFQELLLSLGGWKDQIKNSQSVEVRENATRVLKSVLHELNTNFGPDDLKKLEVSTKEVRGAFPDDNDASVASRPLNIRSSIDHPTEYQERGYSTHSEE
jgi:hypothetical protein